MSLYSGAPPLPSCSRERLPSLERERILSGSSSLSAEAASAHKDLLNVSRKSRVPWSPPRSRFENLLLPPAQEASTR